MAIEQINIGNVVNDGLGDDLRTAFQKVNRNFLDLSAGVTVTAVNLNDTGVGIFAQKVGSELQFKTLEQGSGIRLIDNNTSILIASTGLGAFTRVETENGNIDASEDSIIAIRGGNDISVTADEFGIIVDTRPNINQILSSYDFGVIGNVYSNVIELLLAVSNIDFGTIDNPGVLTFDLGEI